MNDYQLSKYCEEIAIEITSRCEDFEDAMVQAYEAADGSEHVIYHYKAHQLCIGCNIDLGEDYLQDMGEPKGGWTYDKFASAIAYGEIHGRIYHEISRIFEGNENQ